MKSKQELILQVTQEIKDGIRDEPLWKRAVELDGGDELVARTRYRSMRVEQLLNQSTHQQSEHKNPDDTINNSLNVLDKKIPKQVNSKENSVFEVYAKNALYLLIVGFTLVGAFKNIIHKITNNPISTTPSVVAPSESAVFPSLAELQAAGILVNKDNNTIWLEGNLDNEMASIFKRVMASEVFGGNETIIIYINSNGGDIYAAMDIGRTVRHSTNNSGVMVAVHTNGKCYSSCVLVLAGAEQRGRLGKIGIHRPYATAPSSDSKQIAKWQAQLANDVKAYLREVNVQESLYDAMMAYPPDSIYIFKTEEEMDRFGLLQIDPVLEEQLAAVQMRRYSITDRSIYLQRLAQVKATCYLLENSEAANICMERVFSGFDYN